MHQKRDGPDDIGTDPCASLADVAGRTSTTNLHISVRFASARDALATEPWTGDDLRLPPRYTATFDEPTWPLVEVDVLVRDGRLEMERVQFQRRPDGPRVQVAMMRSIPLQGLIEETIPMLLTKVEETSPGNWKLTPVVFGTPRDAKRSRIEARAISVNRRRGGAQPDRAARAVEALEVWRRAEDLGSKRTKPTHRYVMEALNVSRTVAYRLRDEGLAAEQQRGTKRGRTRRKAK